MYHPVHGAVGGFSLKACLYHLTNCLMKKHGKKYEAAKKLVTEKEYSISDAVALLKKTSPVKFDASCEVHICLGIDTAKGDQMVRSSVVLPNGTGKKVRVVAFVNDNQVKDAKEAGAVEAGGDDLVEKISQGWLDFDTAVAVPDMMKKLGKIAKTLGQKGLMPNPKAGTVTPDPVKVIKELNKGKIEFRADKFGITHNTFGKVSFTEEQLAENLKEYIRAVTEVKPASVKGTYIKNISVATTMGPGMKIKL